VSMGAAARFTVQEMFCYPVSGKLGRAGDLRVRVDARHRMTNDPQRRLRLRCVFRHTVVDQVGNLFFG
jgi:hypothetical protein